MLVRCAFLLLLSEHCIFSWSDGSPLKWKLNWNVNEPNDYGGNEACVEMAVRNGRWNDRHCAVRQGYVCEQPAPGTTRPPSTASSPSPGTSDNDRPSAHWGCPKGFHKLADKCYGVFGAENEVSRLSWAQANVACGKMGVSAASSGLASITSAVENAFVTTLLREHQVSSWLGLQRAPDGQYRWWDNQDLTFQHWNRDEPNMPTGQTSCVYMYGPAPVAGKWNDVDCHESAAYVCQVAPDSKFPEEFKPPSSRCSSLGGFELYGDSCLKLSKTPAMWPEAETECLSVMSSLVSVMNAFDQAKVFLYSQQIQSELWLGLSDDTIPGSFLWSSGYPVTFTPWASGQPTKRSCVYMNMDGEFESAACSQSRPFVCRSENEPPQASPTPPGGYCTDLQIFGKLSNVTEVGSVCYYYVPHALSQAEASRVCHKLGGTLAAIHDHNLRKLGLSTKVWIGMSKDMKGTYYWLDGSPVNFINWALGYPNNKDPENACVVMATDGTWFNQYCATRLPFLCAVTKAYPNEALSLPPAKWTPPQFVKPTTLKQKIPTLTIPTLKQSTTVSDIKTSKLPSHGNPGNPTTTGPFASWKTSYSKSTKSNRQENTSNAFPDGGNDKLINGFTSKSAVKPTRAVHPDESGRLKTGDKAAIALGVIVAVLISILVTFVFLRYRSNNGLTFFRRSVLRRELSRAKNFENSLYEATRKDTLTARERVETLTVETLSFEGPGLWPEEKDSSSSSCSQSGKSQPPRPNLSLGDLGHQDLESDSDTPNGVLCVSSESFENKELANGTHNHPFVFTDEATATQMDVLPLQKPDMLESQA
ncbi:macrophage mannose receptor 1 [Elysia marginata]|uniref:Macrophage mannose receptor 1 n=1 Tax=Elysia marginata TaxID=1093978 RepID=A0AAV4IED8_9GAST|nr:macrophage mannose receptor 1 [Elysia marginata]